MRLMAKVINMLNFIVIDLQLYKVFKITRVSFLAHSVYPFAESINSEFTLRCVCSIECS